MRDTSSHLCLANRQLTCTHTSLDTRATRLKAGSMNNTDVLSPGIQSMPCVPTHLLIVDRRMSALSVAN